MRGEVSEMGSLLSEGDMDTQLTQKDLEAIAEGRYLVGRKPEVDDDVLAELDRYWAERCDAE
jgi:hypothetical protein